MDKKPIVLFLAIILTGIILQPASACRYTVCEIGYAEFRIDHYRLIFFNDDDIGDALVSSFKRTAHGALLDANVKMEIIDVNLNREDTVLAYYNAYKKAHEALAVLVAPDGRTYPFELTTETSKFNDSVWNLLEAVVSSPIRKQIKNQIIRSFAVVLFVEGDNANENTAVLNEIKGAMEGITEMQKSMPKPFENPPQLIVITKDQIKNEQVLLWSLGWKQEQDGMPAAAVLYGRGRMMGRLLSEELLRKEYIYNLMTIVGADCECGLDRTWILGSMMPLRWNRKNRKEVVKWHQFDAENPTVKAEMSQILSISPGKAGRAGTNTLYGYTEGAIKIIESYESELKSETPSRYIEEENKETGLTVPSSGLYWIIAFIILIDLVVLWLFIKRKRRQ